MMAQHFFAEFRNRQEAENNKQNFFGKKSKKLVSNSNPGDYVQDFRLIESACISSKSSSKVSSLIENKLWWNLSILDTMSWSVEMDLENQTFSTPFNLF